MKDWINRNKRYLKLFSILLIIICVFLILLYTTRPYKPLDIRYEGVFEIENFDELPTINLQP